MFTLDIEQQVKLATWCKDCEAVLDGQAALDKLGAIGGRYTFSFTHTGLGLITEVVDNATGRKINLTDFSDW